ncbi:MAG TPA: site-2 protease family protein [Flavobacteriales bacterium]|nr:site-2 protease family protein [Flavobacteriales bacterium]|tara:strand:+ start:62180 stop:63295 length:1116 start_codon:yes stop_codon:yes gene_type:complete
MNGALKIGTVKGIKIQIHWSFWIIVFWIMMTYYMQSHNVKDALMGGVFVLAIFACVVLHELGHALTAMHYGIKTKSITLLPIGGLANLEKIPEKPKQEFVIAIAGPMVNILITFILYFVLQATDMFPTQEDLKRMLQNNQKFSAQMFLFNLMAANMILALFNFIPAFPMDGGRMLRALLALKMDRVTATQIASSIGKTLAIVFIFLGFFFDFWLVFIGLFVYLGAGAEAIQEQNKVAFKGVKVKSAMMRKFPSFAETETLEDVVKHMLKTQDKEFLIFDINFTQVVGVLTQNEILTGIQTYGGDTLVSEVMNRDFVVLHENEDLNEAYLKLLSSGLSAAPVVNDEGQVVGMIDSDNIKEFMILKLSHELKN